MKKNLKETSLHQLETRTESCESGGETESAKQDIVRIVSDFANDKKSIGFNDKSFERLAAVALQLQLQYLKSNEIWQFEAGATLNYILLSEIPRILKQKGFKEDVQPESLFQNPTEHEEPAETVTEPAADEENITTEHQLIV